MMSTIRRYCIGAAVALSYSVRAAASVEQVNPIYLDPSKPIDARVEDLLARLTPQEKDLLVRADSKFGVAGIERLGIPARQTDDGPQGVREDVGRDTWEPAGRTDDFATFMPVMLCLSASFDESLAKTYGQVVGEEARYRGKAILLGPSVNIMRTPLCGRNFEYMGEDPFLTSRIAVNYVKGMQLSDVSACIKHYALNNQEYQRGSIDVHADDRTIREIYLPAFETAVKEGGVLSVMGAYNKFRGQHCCENELLLNEILKKQWGFKGLVISDWGGVHDTREAGRFGLDLEMGTAKPTYDEYYLGKPLLSAIEAGQVPMSALDDKVRRNLYVMFATKMFDPPATRAKGSFNTREHQTAARNVAEGGIVLLKNEKNTLPLDPAKIRSIAVIGDNAIRSQAGISGGAGVKAFYEVSPLQGIVARVQQQGITVTFAQGYKVPSPPRRPRPSTLPGSMTTTSLPATTQGGGYDVAGVRRGGFQMTNPSELKSDKELIARAVEAAKNADVAIIVGGLNHTPLLDSEGRDRLDMKMPYSQPELIAAVEAVNPRTIVVLYSGGPVEMDPWLDSTPAVVEAWYGGMEAGNALANVLFGDVNPSGKLPCTFPRKLSDSPAHALGAYPGTDGSVEYKEGVLVGYRWFDTKHLDPLFPFGFGLSYTSFEYSDLKCASDKSANDGAFSVECEIANTGSRAGAEVVQVYLRDADASVERPEKELKGIAKVELAPGEKKVVHVALPPRAFAFWDTKSNDWKIEAGKFQVLVGSSSRDIRLHGEIDQAADRTIAP